MSDPLVTLTTDFGTDSPYVAAMKGVILCINPRARIVDLSHDVPPQDVRHVSFFLAEALPYFPPGTLHVVVVDPGVGSARAILYVGLAGQRLLVPDNGCWTLLAEGHHAQPLRVVRVSEPRFWRPQVSPTFHGRDIFAPVAGYLSLGINPAELGPALTDWVRLPWPAPARKPDGIRGEVIFVDHFGNLISNICATNLGARPDARVRVGPAPVPRRVRTYADAAPGELVALSSSNGLLEVAVVRGSAARLLGAAVGSPVLVEWPPGAPAAGAPEPA
jgi:S-adenosylmethionine hydrolase